MGEPSSILLVRLSAIGDIVMASPMIGALRRRFPSAHISWLVQPESRDLLLHNEQLDEVILWPRSRWLALWNERRWYELWREVAAFRRMLRRRHFDLAIDLQGLLKSGLLVRLSGARERIGLASKEGSHWLMTRVVERGKDRRRIGSEYFHLARELALESGDFEMQIALSEADLAFPMVSPGKALLASGFVVVCPFTTRPQKHWFQASWVELLHRLGQEHGLRAVVLGGPDDHGAAGQLCQAVPGTVNLAGETSLTQAAAVISRARLLVGVDTGLTHMGIAFARPTLALFGATCPYTDTTRKNAQVLYHQFPCSPCRRRPTCNGAFHCMAAIGVDEVMATAERLLGEEQAAT